MMAMEPYNPHQQSLLKRSTSIWRRFSKRERGRPAPPVPAPVLSPVAISAPVPVPAPARSNTLRRTHTHKLQKRTADTLMPTNIITTHMQRVDIGLPAPKQRPEPTPIIPSPTRVLGTDIQTSAFPASPRNQTVAWNIFLTPDQVYRLVMGFRPVQMEDKWFIYSEGPDNSGKLKVHFHRSWTGIKIAELFVLIDLKGLGAGKIVGIKWNGSDQTNGMDEEEAKYMISTTCAWVLDVKIEKGFSLI